MSPRPIRAMMKAMRPRLANRLCGDEAADAERDDSGHLEEDDAQLQKVRDDERDRHGSGSFHGPVGLGG